MFNIGFSIYLQSFIYLCINKFCMSTSQCYIIPSLSITDVMSPYVEVFISEPRLCNVSHFPVMDGSGKE